MVACLLFSAPPTWYTLASESIFKLYFSCPLLVYFIKWLKVIICVNTNAMIALSIKHNWKMFHLCETSTFHLFDYSLLQTSYSLSLTRVVLCMVFITAQQNCRTETVAKYNIHLPPSFISLHCISPNLCRTSLHQFQHFFWSIKNPLVYHRYCSYCFLLADDRATETCPNPLFSKDLTKTNSFSFFIEVPIASQIRNLFAKSAVYENFDQN